MAIGGFTTPIFSLPGMILADMAKIRKEDQAFKDLKKKLKRDYSVGKIVKLNTRYARDHQKFEAAFQALAGQFVTDYERFRGNYTTFMNAVLETLNAVEQESYTTLQEVDGLIEKIKTLTTSNPKAFFFPEKVTQKFAKNFDKAMRTLAAQLQQDYQTISGIKKGKRYAAGILSFFTNNRSAERKGMRAAGKLKDQVEHQKGIVAQVQAELEGGIRQDFLVLLLQYVSELEKTDTLLKDLKRDLEIIMQSVGGEVGSVILKIAPFIAMVQKDATLSARMAAARDTFTRAHGEILAKINKEGVWPVYDDAEVRTIFERERALLAEWQSISKAQATEVLRDVMGKEGFAPA